MNNDFINITFADKDFDTSTMLHCSVIKKNHKIHNKLILGVSSLIFLSNTNSLQFGYDNFYENTNYIYIPSSICFPGNSEIINNPISFGKIRIVAKAKMKKKYFISDEELENKVKVCSNNLTNGDAYSSIDDFVKYNSGRFISSLDKWL